MSKSKKEFYKKRFPTNTYLKKLEHDVKTILAGLPTKERDSKEALHHALRELGWSESEIKGLSARKKQESKKVSASFKYYASKDGTRPRINMKPLQGGAPGLGKKK